MPAVEGYMSPDDGREFAERMKRLTKPAEEAERDEQREKVEAACAEARGRRRADWDE